jgi:pyruvate dehydrogenase E2 component (dihydrolipoamide acetyltransferase)
VLETFFDEGALVPVFTNLFVIGEAGESVDAFRPQGAAAPAVKEAAPTATPEAPKAERQAVRPAPAASSGPLSPRARRFAAEHDFHPAAVTGSGPAGRVLEDDLRQQFHESPRASSLANQRIGEGMEIGGEGSGTGGMVLSGDLVPPGPAATRMSGIRGTIARRMRESLTTTAQYTLHTSANAGGLLLMRAKIKASTGVPDININDLVTFCAIQALIDVPDVNVEFIDGKIYKHREIHIGFACDTPRGLMVPVVRDAHKLTAGQLSVRMKELTAQAVKGTVSPDDLSGATFTVSNLGGLGIESFTPVLNPPQVAILGVDSIQLKPVRREGRIEFIDAIGLSITLDHQVIDGAPGARFLKVVKEKIENVESLCTI